MEVFIAYTNDSLISDLTRTLEAWDKIEMVEPIAIEVPVKKYELIRRVTAESMASGDYILCDLGCVPNSQLTTKEIKEIFKKQEKVGMIRFSPNGAVRACRKGIVERWPSYRGGSYESEHERAYSMEGYTTPKWPTLLYHRQDVH